MVVHPDGSRSFLIGHRYEDDGSFTAEFLTIDTEGAFTSSGDSLTVVGAAPTGTLALNSTGTDFKPGEQISLRFDGVADSSPADTEAGFTYYYRVNGGAWQSSTSAALSLAPLPPGLAYTIEAFVADKDGEQSSITSVPLHVLSDRVLVNSGTGAITVYFRNADGTYSQDNVAAGATYYFRSQITNMSASLQTAGATYDLRTNFSFDQVLGNDLTGVTLTVRTDYRTGLPDYIGDGHIGWVTVGSSCTVTVSSRGDFGGLGGGPDSNAVRLTFANQTGPILADRAGKIVATGSLSDITLMAGAETISAHSLTGTIRTNYDTSRSVPPLVLTYVIWNGSVYSGNQFHTTYGLDALGRTISFQSGPAVLV